MRILSCELEAKVSIDLTLLSSGKVLPDLAVRPGTAYLPEIQVDSRPIARQLHPLFENVTRLYPFASWRVANFSVPISAQRFGVVLKSNRKILGKEIKLLSQDTKNW
jgi:hypothetical protein